ncbi:hypothetical protein L2E82_22264 [Cichorium intybus]|uniref:Uncharacterized protein n=1 Tax=Cichorium intybus TaxID=13427 RepID=A0ACB9DXL2_CICIN|nr:hypothetical protein L2E82_22264 [Cichorium intybus]
MVASLPERNRSISLPELSEQKYHNSWFAIIGPDQNQKQILNKSNMIDLIDPVKGCNGFSMLSVRNLEPMVASLSERNRSISRRETELGRMVKMAVVWRTGVWWRVVEAAFCGGSR